jgi:hypothetical protein
MKNFIKLLYAYSFILFLLSCNQNKDFFNTIQRKNDLSKVEFDKLLEKLDATSLDVDDLAKIMKKDPDVILYVNRIARNAEMTLNDDFDIFNNGKAKKAINEGTTKELEKSAKDKKGKSWHDYHLDLIKNYITIYYKYVIYKKVPKEKFKQALSTVRPTKTVDGKVMGDEFITKFIKKK